MITAYHRPQTMDDARKLLSRQSPVTLPLGGGTSLVHYRGDPVEVVDLQALGLDRLTRRGHVLEVGATSTLQRLLESPESSAAMKSAISLEATLNLRNSATVAGTLMVCDGRSSFVSVLLALDAHVQLLLPQEGTIGIGELLAMRQKLRRGALITSVKYPNTVVLEFDYVARTPADTPIVCVALAQWPSGRTRLAVGGFGAAPLLAMDGTDASGVEEAARNACHEATDPWGSAEYRMSVAAVLAGRCLQRLSP